LTCASRPAHNASLPLPVTFRMTFTATGDMNTFTRVAGVYQRSAEVESMDRRKVGRAHAIYAISQSVTIIAVDDRERNVRATKLRPHLFLDAIPRNPRLVSMSRT
jgi:hypothetical protein